MELWNACAEVLRIEKKPLEIWRVSKVTGLDESKIISTLIHETEGSQTRAVIFRYPPFPCAAIVRLEE